MTEVARTLAPPLRARLAVNVKMRVTRFGSLFAVMYLIGLGFSVSALNPGDEAWFVQVIARMRDGDVLYRDISYGAGPLPAYLTDAVTYVVGVDVFAAKLVTVLAFAASATLAWAVAERLGLGLKGRLLVLGGVAYFSPPLPLPAYGPLATTFVVAALLAALVCRDGDQARTKMVASIAGGSACGFAFVCKQNVGAYALLAFVVILVVDRRVLNAVVAAASFAAGVGALLAPVLLSGGFGRYVDYGFTGKGEYVHTDASPVAAFHGLLQTIENIDSPATAQGAYWAGRLVLPCLAALALVALLSKVRHQRSRGLLPLVVFAAAAGATLFPRFDSAHVAYVAPLLVLLVAYALNARRSRIHRYAFFAIATWVGVAVVLMASLPARLARSPEANLSTLPHLRGAFVQRSDEATWRSEAAKLVTAAHGERAGVLLLVPDAGLLYLITGLRNPTAFDFPLVTTYGRNGQAHVAEALAAGHIKRVCVAGEWLGLEPKRLVHYVRTTMRPGADLGICRLYSRR